MTEEFLPKDKYVTILFGKEAVQDLGQFGVNQCPIKVPSKHVSSAVFLFFFRALVSEILLLELYRTASLKCLC